jgi:glycosylphosphatidylinositol transamidase (GPIT) subunit GPI8
MYYPNCSGLLFHPHVDTCQHHHHHLPLALVEVVLIANTRVDDTSNALLDTSDCNTARRDNHTYVSAATLDNKRTVSVVRLLARAARLDRAVVRLVVLLLLHSTIRVLP